MLKISHQVLVWRALSALPGKTLCQEEIQLRRYLVHSAFIETKRREFEGVWGNEERNKTNK